LGKGGLEIRVDADNVRLDPQRWTPLWSVLVHVVRNAVDHGLEMPERRSACGKQPNGTLRFAARHIGACLRIEIEDDGQGIDWDAVRRRCRERGLPSETRTHLVDALIAPGFSTRQVVTEQSGRGIGLSAVAAVISDLRGKMDLDETSVGTCCTMTLPMDGAIAGVTAPKAVIAESAERALGTNSSGGQARPSAHH
jgi:chemotaxis protein histidine kinase CheA